MHSDPIALRLKRLRDACGITQEDAAAAIGKTVKGYQRFENPTRFKRLFLPMEVAQPMATLAQARGHDPAPFFALAGVLVGAQMTPASLASSDVVPGQLPPGDNLLLEAAIAISAAHPNVAPWIVRSRAVELRGYMIGDVVLTDCNQIRPVNDSIIMAEIADAGMRQRILRVFRPPFLVAASTNPAFSTPLLIEPGRVTIQGTVIADLRIVSAAA